MNKRIKRIIIFIVIMLVYISFLTITSSQGLDYIKQCSFYIPNATCEQMINVCNTEATFILRDANKNLGLELDECYLNLEEFEKININRGVLFLSIVLNIFLLILRTIDNVKKKESLPIK